MTKLFVEQPLALPGSANNNGGLFLGLRFALILFDCLTPQDFVLKQR